MAAGRHSSYPNNEFRDLQYDFDPSRRDSTFSKDGNPRGYGKGNPEKGRIQAMKDTPSIRPKDIKERDVINGGYRSSSGKSDLKISFARHRFLVRSVDREPGELSSDSGSDVAMEPGPCAKDNDVLKTENETQFPMNPRKRKFSPIIWDSDEKEASKKCKTTVGRNSSNLLPPSMPKALRLSPNIISCSVEETSPKKYSKPNISQASLMNHSASSNSYANALPDSLVLSPSQHQLHLGNDKDADQLDDEYYVPTAWNITASRWADNAAASAEDEGDVSDKEEISNKRRRLFCSELLNSRANHRSLSPELGELSVERPWTNPPDCAVRINRGRSSSSDDYPGSDFQNNDYRAVDDECDVGIPSTSHSKTDSEKGSDYHDTPEPARPLQRSLDMLHGCRSVDDFERLNKIDEGTYGVVYRAKDNKTGEIVALKKVKMEKEREGFPLTSLREINIILSFHHSSIVDVKEVVVGSSIDSIFMVMEYMEHDLKALMETMKQSFSQSEVKCLMIQLLEGVKYLHDNWVLHRDLKTSNLLLNNRGELKICDFGLSRQYGSPLKPYTHLVVTLWYRAPELLLGAKQYSTAIDMWSLGCIMAEILSRKPLFDGKTEVEQLDKIFRTLGTPNETIWSGFSKLPGVKFNFVKHQYNVLRKKFPATSFTGFPVLSDSGFELLNKFLTYDPDKRITAEEALNHEWFHEVPLPKSKDFMPTFPSQHVRDRRLRQVMKSPDPLEEQRRKELQHGELGMSGLFG